MNFIVNKVVELEHIDATDSNAIFKRFASSAVEEEGFTVFVETGELNSVHDVFFARAVENGSSDMKSSVGALRQAISIHVEAEFFKVASYFFIFIFDTDPDLAYSHT